MCGLAGFFDGAGCFSEAELRDTVESMAALLRHRGPDSSGSWIDPAAGIALGYRRLAIIDISPAGHQPMISSSGRWVIVFNGEIYNFGALRRDLEQAGDTFVGRSDTEVLLAAIQRWGVEPALSRAAGMFALALWDRKERTIHLARDRLGKKPLYFGWLGQSFAFASELKAFFAHPEFRPEVSRTALSLYLKKQYVPSPYSIWSGIFKLPPGSRLSLKANAEAPRGSQVLDAVRPYWSASAVVEQGLAEPRRLPDQVLVDQFDDLLSEAVRERMISDVPLGAFLSGGIDSSVVVALMQKQASRPVRTFTVGFAEGDFNEAEHARQVAQSLKTDHSEFRVTPREAREVIPDLPTIYDEPFADPSQIPTFHVARLAKQHVTVCLSGDGGDELFAGYTRYLMASGLLRRIHRLPMPLRRAAAHIAQALPPDAWDGLLRMMPVGLPYGLRGQWSGDRVHKLADLIRIADPIGFYSAFLECPGAPEAAGAGSLPTQGPPRPPTLAAKDWIASFMYQDLVGYLPDDILVKMDRATMAVSLEARSPLLDHRVVEFAWRLPLSAKVLNGNSKWLLRRLFERYLPPDLAQRPKQGFGLPLASWLRDPLRPWAEALLDQRRLAEEGFIVPKSVHQKWREHVSGRRNWSAALWTALMFQAWHERWGSVAAPARHELRSEARPAATVFATGST